MAVIMVLKQTINNIFEFTVPWVFFYFNCTCKETDEFESLYENFVWFSGWIRCSWFKSLLSKRAEKKLSRKCGHCYRKACRDVHGRVEPCDTCKLRVWLKNYHLSVSDAFSLFNEFLEMGRSNMQAFSNTSYIASFLCDSLLSLVSSDPVQFYHHICGSLPSCTSSRSRQQRLWDPLGRHQDGPFGAASDSQEDQWYRLAFERVEDCLFVKLADLMS